MEFNFNSEEWLEMTALQRAERCRIFAEQAQKLAAQSSENFQAIYLEMAMQWLKLANEIYREWDVLRLAALTVDAPGHPRQRN